MKVLLSWIRDFVDVPGTPEEVGRRMSLRGLALEGVEPAPPGSGLPPGRIDERADAVMDFDVTANRPDCLSVLGIAREVACAFDLPLTVPGPGASGWLTTPDLAASDGKALPVTIEEPDLCARYSAAVASVTVGPSPAWMQTRLHALGVRPINNIVDITNYVLLELGQPMHAFDFVRLAGPAIVIRRARGGESVKTLDGKVRALASDMLAIADADRVAAIGGVMGGAESEVTAATTTIVLEAAWFNPVSVRATSRRLALRTEASYRFERGADVTATIRALARACALIELIGAGARHRTVVDAYPRPYQPATLSLSRAQIQGLLGMDVPSTDVERILRALGFGIRVLGGWHAAAPEVPLPVGVLGDNWRVEVPAWRLDIRRPVDLIEEVGRHHGFEHLPSTFPGVEQAPPPSDPRVERDARVRRALLGMGFSEAISFAFVERAAASPFIDREPALELANPLSEKFTTMRPSLIPGLVDAVSHNRRHARRDIRLFEVGTRFTPRGEERAAAVAWTGLATADHWSGGRRDVDFFDLKGVVEQLCAVMRATASFAPVEADYLVEGRAAEVWMNGERVGVLGLLDPIVAEARGVPPGDLIYVGEVNLDALGVDAVHGVKAAESLPRHPSVVRDISILVDDTLSADTVRGTIRAAAPLTLMSIREFDRYQGQGVPDGKVSLSLRLVFQALDRTLTDDEVREAMHAVAAALTKDLGAVQR
ncbi:MAG: phenylalanine--tRNA ligase subunit beta [Vicinamibacterales bacterium]